MCTVAMNVSLGSSSQCLAWPTDQIQPITCYCMAHELTIVFLFLTYPLWLFLHSTAVALSICDRDHMS